MVNDAPLFFDAGVTGGQPWEPKNYDGKFEGPMPLHTALAKSKNMVSIRVLQAVGTQNAQDWITRFGFDAEKHPPYLTMALGAGAVTPMQMATAYSVFANGGYRINPWLITKITDQRGKALVESQPPLPNESVRAVDARNAFIMSRLLQEITRSGTAARAQRDLKRVDLYGKTGTTNDSIDTWFAGYQPTLTAVVWMGYDNPRSLGDRETGGGLSLPVWISFMEAALKGVPVMEPSAPEGVRECRRRVVLRGVRAWRRRRQRRRRSPAGKRARAGPRPRAPEDKSLMNSDGLPPSRPPSPPIGGAQEHPGPVQELTRSVIAGSVELQGLARLLAGVAREVGEELAIALGVHPAAPRRTCSGSRRPSPPSRFRARVFAGSRRSGCRWGR